MKECTQCKQNKDSIQYYKDKRTKSGLYSACKKCTQSMRGYKYNYKDSDSRKEWVKANKESLREYKRSYDKKLRENPKYRANMSIACSMSATLQGRKNGRKWQLLVGYSLQDLIEHLENQFDENMSWNNYGKYWHIDHIIPLSYYKYINPEDENFKKCWALSNLQPLEKAENIRKSNKLPEHLTPPTKP